MHDHIVVCIINLFTFVPGAVRYMGLRFSVQFFRRRSWLRATTYAFALCTGIMRFLACALGARPGKAVQRLCGDRTEIVRCRWSLRAVSADSARKSCGARARSVQRPRGDGALTVQWSHDYPKSLQSPDHRTIFCPIDHLKACVFRKTSALPPHDSHTIFLRDTLRFCFQMCQKSSLNKIVEATAPVNPYENRTAATCLRTEAARQGSYGHDTSQ